MLAQAHGLTGMVSEQVQVHGLTGMIGYIIIIINVRYNYQIMCFCILHRLHARCIDQHIPSCLCHSYQLWNGTMISTLSWISYTVNNKSLSGENICSSCWFSTNCQSFPTNFISVILSTCQNKNHKNFDFLHYEPRIFSFT